MGPRCHVWAQACAWVCISGDRGTLESSQLQKSDAACSRALQQSAGEPAGGGVALGSNGSRAAPQLGSVRDSFAFEVTGDEVAGDEVAGDEVAGDEGVTVVDVGDETVATVRARRCAVEDAADPWQPAMRLDAATSAAAASDRRAAGLMASFLPASRR